MFLAFVAFLVQFVTLSVGFLGARTSTDPAFDTASACFVPKVDIWGSIIKFGLSSTQLSLAMLPR